MDVSYRGACFSSSNDTHREPTRDGADLMAAASSKETTRRAFRERRGTESMCLSTSFTYAKYSQSSLFSFVAGAHKAARPVVQLRGHRRLCRLGASLLPNTAPMKCPRGPVPWVVAKASGEAARDQEMAHLVLARSLVSLSDLSFQDGMKAVFSSAVSGHGGPMPWPNMVLHTALHHGGHFCTPPCRGAGNVRAGTEPGARFGRADSPGAPTGWAIPPDPQQARGGKTPVQGDP